jgi:hypothetical protein
MRILAKNDRGERLMPINCPQYPDGDISCVSSSGDSICGCFWGSLHLENMVHLIQCEADPEFAEMLTDGDE